MAILKFINGRNEKKAGLIRAIDYIIDENKTEAFNLKEDDVESLFIDQLIENNKGNRAINYITKDEKTSINLTTGINCSPESAFEEMMITKKMFNKEGGRQFIHFTHSYSDKEKIDPALAHEISLKLIEHPRFKDFQIIAATHVDKDHIHTHFVLNTVNAETGKKWRQSRKELEGLKDYSNELCKEYGLKHSIVETKKEISNSITSGEYRAKKEGRSWKYELWLTVNECIKISMSKDDFIKNMNDLGYQVRWVDNRKNITFILPNGRKCNNDKLHPPKSFTKEALLKKFELNKQFIEKKDTIRVERQIEDRKNLILETIRILSDNPSEGDKNYPLTYLEGQALKEKMIEQEKGQGLDWEREM